MVFIFNVDTFVYHFTILDTITFANSHIKKRIGILNVSFAYLLEVKVYVHSNFT